MKISVCGSQGTCRTSCHKVLELQVWQSRARSGFVLALLLPCGGAKVTDVVKSITICKGTGVILSRLLLCHQNWVVGVCLIIFLSDRHQLIVRL